MFLNPLMLAGLGGAVLPVVLHLLSRARYRRIDFGAMMFLMPALASRSRHGARLKELALLLTRMAIVAALAVAFARPVLRAGALPAGAESARVGAAIILDCSASMSCEEFGQQRMDQAKAGAINVLASLRRGDSAALIFSGAEPDDSPDATAPTSDLQSLAARVDAVKPSFDKADIAAALMQAARAFQSDNSVSREIYVICDRQAINWVSVDAPFVAAWRNTAMRDGMLPRMFLILVGGENSDNVGIESLSLRGPPLVRGQNTDLEVRVRNFGEHVRSAIPLNITTSDGSRELYRGTLSVPAKSSSSLAVPVRFAAAGSHLITAKLSLPGFKADDQIDLAIDVMEPVKVLAIGAAGSAPDFLALALEPFRSSGLRGVDPATMTRASVERWPDVLSDRPDVVVLDDVPLLSQQHLRALEQFVYTGGGLLVAPGPLSQVENYDRMLFKEYTGLLPARPRTPADAAVPTYLASVDHGSPIFDFMHQRDADALLRTASIERYLPTIDRVGARVLASYANGEPFLLERAYSRGHVIFCTTSLEGSWNSLPRTNCFLPLVQSMVCWLARPDEPPRNLAVGQSIEASLAGPLRGRTATLTLPSGTVRQIELTAAGGRFQARFADTRVPGRYTMRATLQGGGETIQDFVVRPTLEESDATPLPEERWKWIEQALGAQRIDADKSALAAVVTKQRSGSELYLPIVALVGALLLVEICLVRLWTVDAV